MNIIDENIYIEICLSLSLDPATQNENKDLKKPNQ